MQGGLHSSGKREILLLSIWSFQGNVGLQYFQVYVPIIPARKGPTLQLNLGLIFSTIYNRYRISLNVAINVCWLSWCSWSRYLVVLSLLLSSVKIPEQLTSQRYMYNYHSSHTTEVSQPPDYSTPHHPPLSLHNRPQVRFLVTKSLMPLQSKGYHYPTFNTNDLNLVFLESKA